MHLLNTKRKIIIFMIILFVLLCIFSGHALRWRRRSVIRDHRRVAVPAQDALQGDAQELRGGALCRRARPRAPHGGDSADGGWHDVRGCCGIRPRVSTTKWRWHLTVYCHVLYTPYISRGFYFREFLESGAISEFNNTRIYLPPIPTHECDLCTQY